MSLNPLVSREHAGFNGRISTPSLGLYDGTAPRFDLSRSGLIASENAETTEIWRELLGSFLDQEAARRFLHFAEIFAEYRWKPSLSLILPEQFRLTRVSHRRDLVAALELLASVMDHYRLDVLSDSPDAARLFRNVDPPSPDAISRSSASLVLLSRSLARQIGASHPTRYVSSDPHPDHGNARRIVFNASEIDAPGHPADDTQFIEAVSGSLSVFIDEDEHIPSFVQMLCGLRERGVLLRLTLSARTDTEFMALIRNSFAHAPEVEILAPTSSQHRTNLPIQLSNETTVLLDHPDRSLPRFLYRDRQIWKLGPSLPPRSDFQLLRGEELSAHRVLRTWLGRWDSVSNASRLDLEFKDEPLVSIVIPVHDDISQLIHTAHSIYHQNYQWIELIFVSHGSAPETLEAIRISENLLMKRKFKVRIIELAEAGKTTAVPLNVGIRASDGDLICLLKPGDRLGADFFNVLSEQPWRRDTLYYPSRESSEVVDPERSVLDSAGLLEVLRAQGNVIGDSGVCFARSLFDRSGGIDLQPNGDEHLDLWCRCAIAGGRAEPFDRRVHVFDDLAKNHSPKDRRRLESTIDFARRQERIQWQ
jgi:hypothetical protein